MINTNYSITNKANSNTNFGMTFSVNPKIQDHIRARGGEKDFLETAEELDSLLKGDDFRLSVDLNKKDPTKVDLSIIMNPDYENIKTPVAKASISSLNDIGSKFYETSIKMVNDFKDKCQEEIASDKKLFFTAFDSIGRYKHQNTGINYAAKILVEKNKIDNLV